MAPALPSLLASGDLGCAELYAARLDGDLYAVDECFAPIDEVDGPWLRASAVVRLVGVRLIAELDTAAWIRGLRPAPPRVHRLCTGRADRTKFPPSERCVVREIQHAPGDLETIAGLRVTTPDRLLYDLALEGGRDRGAEAAAVLSCHPGTGAECRHRLQRATGLPGKRAALRRVLQWCEAAGVSPC